MQQRPQTTTSASVRRPRHGYGASSTLGRIGIRIAEIAAVGALMGGLTTQTTPADAASVTISHAATTAR